MADQLINDQPKLMNDQPSGQLATSKTSAPGQYDSTNADPSRLDLPPKPPVFTPVVPPVLESPDKPIYLNKDLASFPDQPFSTKQSSSEGITTGNTSTPVPSIPPIDAQSKIGNFVPQPATVSTSANNFKPKKSGIKQLIKTAIFILLFLAIISAGGGLVWWLLNRNANTEVTITYWGLWEPESVMKDVLNQYMEANPNVTVNYVNSSPQEYRQRLLNQLADVENPLPDIFRFHNTWVPMMKKYLAPMPIEVFTPEEFKATFYPVQERDLKVGASLVGIPLMIDGLGLYYNEDLLKQAQIEVPKDWVEFRRAANALTVRDGQGNIQIAGAALGSTGNVDHWPDIFALMMMQTGVDLAKPTTKSAEEALTFYTLFSNTDRVWDNTMPKSTEAFATGKLAMYIGPSWRAHEIKQISQQSGTPVRFKITVMPQLPETNITWASYWVEGVNKNSSSATQTAAWDLLSYLSQKEVMEQMYNTQSQIRDFGEIYSRLDLADQLKSHPLTGAYVLQAPAAQSWYLASDTTDKAGINERIINYYKDAIGLMLQKGQPEEALKTVPQGVSTVLNDYNIK